jgi:AraC-like DNA-binding protein
MSLESPRENVNEEMYSVGYLATRAFRTLFKQLTGISPVAYREMYSRKEAA